MNRIELIIYNIVKSNPKLKRFMVENYQKLFSLIPRKSVKSDYPIKVCEQFFYGFHDKCPWSLDNKMLLAHHFNIPYRKTMPDDEIEVGYFAGPEFLDYKLVGTTRAWSWQNGAMLQWVGPSFDIIYNDYDGKELIAKIVDIKGKGLKILPRPIGAVSLSGQKALSFNFKRFENGLPGYGCVNGIDPDADVLIPSRKGDGLHIIDIESGQIRELFTVADIASIRPHPTMKHSLNFFSHCQFSPSGKRFVFFHRWLENKNRLWTRMISCDLNGKDIYIYPTSGMVSHVAWRDDQHVLAYARTDEFGDKYYLFSDKMDKYDIIGEDSFNSDGHPQFSPDKRYILTDTYPDRFRMQFLIIYDTYIEKRYNIARLKLPLKFLRELHVDLHPRWDSNGTAICFDSGHTGKRSLCTIKIDLNKLV